MKHQELQFPSFVLLLLLAGSLLSAACSSRSERLIAEAEALAYANLDSAARVLAQVDTSALSERARAIPPPGSAASLAMCSSRCSIGWM